MDIVNLTDITRSQPFLPPQLDDSSDEQQGRKLWGRLLVPAQDCWYPPAVSQQDLLLVNFDETRVTDNQVSLYLVEEVSEGRVIWRGCRRISSHFGQLALDISGTREWKSLTTISSVGLRIVGRVEKVYKPH